MENKKVGDYLNIDFGYLVPLKYDYFVEKIKASCEYICKKYPEVNTDDITLALHEDDINDYSVTFHFQRFETEKEKETRLFKEKCENERHAEFLKKVIDNNLDETIKYLKLIGKI